MTRLILVILVSAPIVLFYVIKSNYVTAHMEDYTEKDRYAMVQNMIGIMQRNGKIETKVYGEDNLPDEGGYVMYPNHQGKYDALGIIGAHKKPCTFLIDKKRSGIPFAREFTALLEASRLDKTNIKAQVGTIVEIARQVKDGRRYIVFPEGGYTDNHNKVTTFLPGAFNCSVKSKTPIVPVALIDSYKVFGINSIKKVTTQVHFLKPIYYEEYKEMSTAEIAGMVRSQIENVVSMYS